MTSHLTFAKEQKKILLQQYQNDHDPDPNIEDQRVEVTRMYPTRSIQYVNGQPKVQYIVQQAVTLEQLKALEQKEAEYNEVSKEELKQIDFDYIKAMQGNEHQRVLKNASKIVYSHLRERLFETMPIVCEQELPELDGIIFEDMWKALTEHGGGFPTSFCMEFLDSFAAGVLHSLGFGKHCCHLCGMVFRDQSELESHEKRKSRMELKCSEKECGKLLCTVDSLKFHGLVAHGKEVNVDAYEQSKGSKRVQKNSCEGKDLSTTCIIDGCDRSFRTVRGLKQHQRMTHNKK